MSGDFGLLIVGALCGVMVGARLMMFAAGVESPMERRREREDHAPFAETNTGKSAARAYFAKSPFAKYMSGEGE